MSNKFFTGKSRKFADPFLMSSTELFPDDIKSTYDLCLYLYRQNPMYGAAMNRLFMYFAQKINIENSDESSEVAKKLRGILEKDIAFLAVTQLVGMEWAIYGNAFVRVVEPFDRYLVDTRNGSYAIHAVSSYPQHLVKFDIETMMYTVPDVKSAKDDNATYDSVPTVSMPFIDKPSPTPKNISIVFLDPRYVTLDSAHHGNSTQVIYTPPPEMVSRVKDGQLNEVNNTPRGLLEAIKENSDYLFYDGEIFHFKAPTPSGVSESGLGCPNILWHFDSLYQLQVYRQADCAIARDFMHPHRIFTPNLSSSAGDITKMTILANWTAEMKRMVALRRKDPTAIHVLPFEVTYNEYGGNGKNFTTHEQVTVSTDALLDGLGIPREMFRGTMNLEQMPTAIKMMEAQYAWMGIGINKFAEFVSRKIASAYDLGDVYASMAKPSIAYDIEHMQLRMQMAANREIPRSSVYGDIGVADPVAASVAAVREDHEIQRKTEEENQRQNKAMTQGSMADAAIMAAEQGVAAAPAGGGGAPAGGGGAPDYAAKPGEDPLALQQRGEEIARTWLKMHSEQPNSHRTEMRNAEAINPTLHAVAVKAMEKLRGQAESGGRANIGEMLG